MRKHAARPFTLVELIAVMGVLILFSAIAIPAYSSLFSGRKTTLAANQLNAAVMEARAHAVSSKNLTALVFAKEEYTKANGSKGYRYAGFRLAEVRKGSGTKSFDWRRWVPDSSLERFPENTMIPIGTSATDSNAKKDFGMTDGSDNSDGGDGGKATPPTVNKLPDGFSIGSSTSAIIFHPNGQLAGTSQQYNIVVRFVEANRYDATNGVDTPRLPLNINWMTCKAKFLDPVQK